jgi:protein-L-isoaspartate(D-aspartate) O-methyltransferase
MKMKAEGMDTSLQRGQMVAEQIEGRGINSVRLLAVFRKVPRHIFVPEEYREQAYEDCPLAIGFGQTISQPFIVALMIDLLKLTGNETVLEVGTGSGYQAALLGYLAGEVHSLERVPELAERAVQILQTLDLTNVHVHSADGSFGWPQAAPFDAIIVAAAAPQPPQDLLDQLAEGGRLVIPVGGQFGQDLQLWIKSSGEFDQQTILPVVFVPMRGAGGWKEEEWR